MIAAAIQLNAGADFSVNVERAFRRVREAAARGAKLVALPENFSFLRTGREIELITHRIPSPFIRELAALAAETGVYLLAGSLHEQVPGEEKLFNTSLFFGPDGELLAQYRKLHIFDLTLPDGGGLCESRHFQPGAETTVCSTPAGVFGLSICYDLRFPELYRNLSRQGAEILLVPSAFTEATGKDHWEVLLRARAIENLSYVIAPALTGAPSPKIRNWGHSMMVDPWGNVLAGAGERETIIYAEIDLEYLRRKRELLPALAHRRLF